MKNKSARIMWLMLSGMTLAFSHAQAQQPGAQPETTPPPAVEPPLPPPASTTEQPPAQPPEGLPPPAQVPNGNPPANNQPGNQIAPVTPPPANNGRPGVVPPSLPPENDMPPPENTAMPPMDNGPTETATTPTTPDRKPKTTNGEGKTGADAVPPGQELVNIDFPEPTEIKDIVKAVSMWTGKNVLLGRDVAGKVTMLSPRKVTKEEAYQMFLSALNMLNMTTVETGSVIKIMPVRNAVKSNLKTYMGASYTPLTDELITQIVPLRYIDAQELQNTLGRVVTTSAMIAYKPTNTLIISDSGYKIRRILDIVELLDVQGQQPQIAFVPIRYADAKSISEKVTEIFKLSQSAKSPSASRGGIANHKLMVDERTNSVIIFGPPRTIQDVRALVKRFDTRIDDPTRQASIHVRPLDYADAKKLAATLSSLSGKSGSAGGSNTLRRPPTPRLGGGGALNSPVDTGPPAVADLGDDVKITADESLNALLVTGSRAAYDSINSLVRKLDVRRSQVFVEAEILDINVDGAFKFGSHIFGGAGKADGNKTAVTWQGGALAPLIGAQVAGNTTASAGAVEAFKEDMNIGILSGTQVNVPGIGNINPGALIRLIKTDAATKALASPHILTANNETAKIIVGDKIFYKTQDVTGVSGAAVTKVQHEDVDLSLEIKPSVSYSNYVTLKVDLDASEGRLDSTAGVPVVNKRKTSQLVTVKNGQTVVISGLVKTSESETYQKIPLLGDIPIIGWLFRNSQLAKKRSNLMIFLTPHIVHGADDMAAIYQAKIRDRDEFLQKVYGSKGTDDDFYAKLPRKEDGEYRADEVDRLEQQNRDRLFQDMRRDMGYGAAAPRAAVPTENGNENHHPDDTVTVPLGSTGAGAGTGDTSSMSPGGLPPPGGSPVVPVPGGGSDDGPMLNDDPPPPMDDMPPPPIDPPGDID